MVIKQENLELDEIDVTTPIRTFGIKKAIDQLGLKTVIEAVGIDEVIKTVGIEIGCTGSCAGVGSIPDGDKIIRSNL